MPSQGGPWDSSFAVMNGIAESGEGPSMIVGGMVNPSASSMGRHNAPPYASGIPVELPCEGHQWRGLGGQIEVCRTSNPVGRISKSPSSLDSAMIAAGGLQSGG